MRKDLHNNIRQVNAFNVQSIASDGDVNGNIIDTQGYGSIEWLIQSSAITDGTYTPKIQEGDQSDLSDAVDLDADNYLGAIADATFGATDDDAVKKLGAKVGNKRYMRLVLTAASTTTGGTLGAQAVLGTPDLAPVA